jgi:hypothetical protein
MKWLFKWLLASWGTMALTCATVVLCSRPAYAPSKLQSYGIDICDGEPCYRGLKPGTAWTKVKELFPERAAGQHIELPFDVTGLGHVAINASRDTTVVKDISIYSVLADNPPLPFGAGDVIAQYGLPCSIGFNRENSVPDVMILIYPNVLVVVDLAGQNPSDHARFGLRFNSPIKYIYIIKNGFTCSNTPSAISGPWRGFTSANVYRQRNLQDMAQPSE